MSEDDGLRIVHSAPRVPGRLKPTALPAMASVPVRQAALRQRDWEVARPIWVAGCRPTARNRRPLRLKLLTFILEARDHSFLAGSD
jgi:hypothetical protein